MIARGNSEKVNMVQNTKKPREELLVQKRHNQWENEVNSKTFAPDKVIPLCNGDRFIPRRYSLIDSKRNKKFYIKSGLQDVFKSSVANNQWRESNFALVINEVFGIKERRVLEFTNKTPASNGISKTTSKINKFYYEGLTGYDWPCKPRSKPSAYYDTTHDLPGADLFFDHNQVDWSIHDQIVASFGQDLILWKRSEDLTLVFDKVCPRALAYSPSGRFLAIGCKSCGFPVLELWEMNQVEDAVLVNGKVFDKQHLDVKCIEWSKHGKIVVCGTQQGTVYVLSVPELRTIRKICRHKSGVTIIKFAPTMRYLATGDAEGNICVYTWNPCEIYLLVRSRRKLNITFDWHPWNGIDLAIAENTPASIAILHVPSKQIVAFYQRRDTEIFINSVTFSKITAELLVGISKQEENGCVSSKIFVMASLDRVVDTIQIPENETRFMMWSPDGTQLATAGSHETLTIWNFCPWMKEHLVEKRVQEENNFETQFGTQFKLWSRLK